MDQAERRVRDVYHRKFGLWVELLDDVLVIPDASKYQYYFTDVIVLDSSDLRGYTNVTHLELISVSSLVNHSAKLVQ